MIIIKLSWWLWNQMFQYATWKAISLRNKKILKLDLSFLNRMWKWYVNRIFKENENINYELSFFNLSPIFADYKDIPFYERYKNKKYMKIYEILKNIFKEKNHYIEKQFNYDDNINNINYRYYDWYFQSEKYFIDFEDNIRKEFEFKIEPSENNKKMIEIINESNSVSVHIRRWDYTLAKNNYIWLQSIEYYNKSIDLIKKKIDNPIFIFFSDDISWVKENIILNDKSFYIDWNDSNTNYEDMRLMSLCKHNIIANSSFSWWWAWLNKNKEKIVIAPKKWFNSWNLNYNDILPDKWIKI